MELECGNISGGSEEFFRDILDIKWEMELRFSFGMIYGGGINHLRNLFQSCLVLLIVRRHGLWINFSFSMVIFSGMYLL